VRLHRALDGPADAPAVVLGPSLGTTLAMWEPQVGPLAERYRVVRYDRRGHGSSPVAPGPATIDDLGADLLELLDDLGLETVAFCGLSLGGLEGMWLATSAPARLDRLVLACSAPSFPAGQAYLERAATVRSEGFGTVTEGALARWFTPAFHHSHPEVVEQFRAMLSATDREGYAVGCEVVAATDLTGALGGISASTLVLTGAEDPVVTPETGERLAAAIPGARHHAIPGAAHIANVERADAFTAALLGHLKGEQ